MVIEQFVHHFTNLNFDIVLLNIGILKELYNGSVREIIDEFEMSYDVIEFEPQIDN